MSEAKLFHHVHIYMPAFAMSFSSSTCFPWANHHRHLRLDNIALIDLSPLQCWSRTLSLPTWFRGPSFSSRTVPFHHISLCHSLKSGVYVLTNFKGAGKQADSLVQHTRQSWLRRFCVIAYNIIIYTFTVPSHVFASWPILYISRTFLQKWHTIIDSRESQLLWTPIINTNTSQESHASKTIKKISFRPLDQLPALWAGLWRATTLMSFAWLNSRCELSTSKNTLNTNIPRVVYGAIPILQPIPQSLQTRKRIQDRTFHIYHQNATDHLPTGSDIPSGPYTSASLPSYSSSI